MPCHLRHARPLLLWIGLATCAGVVSGADDWPHWRGPTRNGVTTEPSGWNGKTWLSKEPAWKKNVGEGASSPLIVGNHIFALGWRNEHDTLYCLDAASGKEQWKATYRTPRYGRQATGDEGMYSGPSSTPEFDGETGYLYSLGADGDLNCWNTRDGGRRVWGFNLYDRYSVPRRPRVGRSGHRDYGFTSSPLVQKNFLIVEVGAAAGNLIAFDKQSGEQLWASQATDPAGHNGGPVPMLVESVPCVAVHHFNGLLVVRLDRGHEGQTAAEWPWQTTFANNIATPAVQDDCVLLTSSYNHHQIAKLRISLAGATKVWEQDQASKVCSPVVHRGRVYWAWQGVHCLDLETGKLLWKGGPKGDPGSCLVTRDDRLITWTGEGDLQLVDTAVHSPDSYRSLAALEKVCQSPAWPHVAIGKGRLICKDRQGNLFCFAVPDERRD